MIALLRHRRVTREMRLELPDGSYRRVKVVTEEERHVQHVHDWQGRVHATAVPHPIPIRVEVARRKRATLRGIMPKGTRQAFAQQHSNGPWVPVPGTVEALVRP